MRILAVFLSLLSVLLVNCQRSSKTTPAPEPASPSVQTPAPPPPAPVIEEGDGWSKTADGRWVFQLDNKEEPDMKLNTPVANSFGEQFIRLPKGARKAVIRSVSVLYCGKEDGNLYSWTVLNDDNGKLGQTVLHRWWGFTVLPKEDNEYEVVEEPNKMRWLRQKIGVPVNGNFWLVYHGNTAVCARQNAGKEGLLFFRVQHSDPQKAQYLPVPHLPYVRVELENVE